MGIGKPTYYGAPLKPDYPMVAPSYARRRQELAKQMGLGRKPHTRPAPKPERSRAKTAA